MSLIVSLLVGVVVVLAITALTAYFVAQEFAFMAVDRVRLATRAAAGDHRAARTLSVTKRTSFMLSGAQLGITVTGLLVGYVAEPLIGLALGDALDSGGISRPWALAIGSALGLTFSTFVQMLFGELYPKNLAIARSETTADALASSTRVYLAVFGPLIAVFDRSAEVVLKLVGVKAVHDLEYAATADDLEHLVDASRHSGDLDDELSDMVDRILDFPRRSVEHAMMPRSRTDVMRSDLTVAEAREVMAVGHTRYPVLDDEDRVCGVLHLLDVMSEPDPTRAVSAVARPALIVSTLMLLPAVLAELDGGHEMACVIDEYGGFVGIITLEDLAEEIVGEITDEHDPDDPGYQPVVGDGIWVLAGDTPVDEVERAIDRTIAAEGDFETLGGLLVSVVGALLEEGQEVDVPLRLEADDLLGDAPDALPVLRAKVLHVADHVPARVRLHLIEAESAAESAAAAVDETGSRQHSAAEDQGGAR